LTTFFFFIHFKRRESSLFQIEFRQGGYFEIPHLVTERGNFIFSFIILFLLLLIIIIIICFIIIIYCLFVFFSYFIFIFFVFFRCHVFFLSFNMSFILFFKSLSPISLVSLCPHVIHLLVLSVPLPKSQLQGHFSLCGVSEKTLFSSCINTTAFIAVKTDHCTH